MGLLEVLIFIAAAFLVLKIGILRSCLGAIIFMVVAILFLTLLVHDRAGQEPDRPPQNRHR